MWFSALVELKKKSGKTLKQISEESKVPLGTLNKLFSGQTKDPKLETVQAVVHALGYTLDDLDDGHSAKKSPSTAEAAPGEALHSVDDWKRAIDKMTKKQCRDAIILLLDKFMEGEE